ncbi:unnamed protein product [Arctogadus glacialis]
MSSPSEAISGYKAAQQMVSHGAAPRQNTEEGGRAPPCWPPSPGALGDDPRGRLTLSLSPGGMSARPQAVGSEFRGPGIPLTPATEVPRASGGSGAGGAPGARLCQPHG